MINLLDLNKSKKGINKNSKIQQNNHYNSKVLIYNNNKLITDLLHSNSLNRISKYLQRKNN